MFYILDYDRRFSYSQPVRKKTLKCNSRRVTKCKTRSFGRFAQALVCHPCLRGEKIESMISMHERCTCNIRCKESNLLKEKAKWNLDFSNSFLSPQSNTVSLLLILRTTRVFKPIFVCLRGSKDRDSLTPSKNTQACIAYTASSLIVF